MSGDNSLRIKAKSNADAKKGASPRTLSDPCISPRQDQKTPSSATALKTTSEHYDEAESIMEMRYETRQSTSMLRTLFVLTLLATCAFAVSDFSMCHNEHSFTKRDYNVYVQAKRQTSDVIGQLFQWCSSDADCAEAYHISTAKTARDEKAFRHISKTWLHMTQSTVDLMRPFNATVCENESFDDLLKTLWIVAMRLNVKETIRLECGANERAVFDTETMQMHCVCISDRNCLDASEWRASSANWSNVTILVAVACLFLVLVQQLLLNIQRRRTFHRLLLQCKKKCGAADEFRKAI